MLKERVRNQFERLEKDRLKMIIELDQHPPDTLTIRPAPNKWNTLQIIFHLMAAERNSVMYISKKRLGGTAVPRATWVSGLKSAALTLALRFLKWKAPKVLPEPPAELNYAELKQQWNSLREHMKILLDELSEDMMGRTIFRQPNAGYLNIPQALRFMQDHFEHHRKQVEKILSKV